MFKIAIGRIRHRLRGLYLIRLFDVIGTCIQSDKPTGESPLYFDTHSSLRQDVQP